MEPQRISAVQPETEAQAHGGGLHADEHIFLIGRPPIQEYMAFLTLQTVGGEQRDRAALADEWRQANAKVAELSKAEGGIADNCVTTDLDPTLGLLVQRVAADPTVAQSFSMVPTRLAMVELDRLVVFQKVVNLTHVRRIQDALGKEPAPDAIFRLCMPFERQSPPVRVERVAGNVWVCASPSNDLRFVEAVTLDPSTVTSYQGQGPVAAMVGLVVGYGSNYLNAISIDGRLILNNGQHRAYALRDLGIRHVPCLVQETTCREEVEALCEPVAQQYSAYVEAPRPPMLRDFFDDGLTTRVYRSRLSRQITVSFNANAMDVPAA